MLEAWQHLVLKWLNCFGVGLLESIKDVREVNFLKVLRPCSSLTGDDPFTQLLTLLQDLYPHFDLSEPSSHCWDDDEELYTLSSLLLLHASIFAPSKVLHQNAAVNLNGVEQRLVVDFLEKAMNHEEKITKQSLLESLPTCIPTIAESTSETQPVLSTSPSSPVPTSKKRRSQGTPLTEFLSSPVARQKRKSGNLRERLCSLENDLEEEQAERFEMEEKIANQGAQIAELEKKCREKSDQIRVLKEDLRKLEDSQEELSRDKGDEKAERRRLYLELTDSEEYIKKLEVEMETIKSARDTAINKLTVAEKQSAEFEEVFNVSRIECSKLKTELELCMEENSELKFKCSQLERDLNQMQSSTLLSPRRPLFNSPNRSFSPAPENLGFIVEKEMIDKENENLELKKALKDLDDELQKLKSAYRELTDKSQKESEGASRLQKKLEAKLSDMQSRVDSTHEELNICKKDKDDLSSRLSDISIERDALGKQLSELASMKQTLAAELKSLNDDKHFLEVKVAKLEAKLLMSAEREKELQEFSTKRSCEMDEIRQKIDAKDVELKKCLKVQKMIEEELNDTRRKLTLAKNVEQEKYDLEEQVMALKQANEEFMKKMKATSEAHDKFQNQWHTLSEEKKSLLSELKELSAKNEDLASALNQVSAEKSALANEKLSLLKEKVCWEEELQETTQRLQDVKDHLAREDLEKNIVQDKLAEALAANDRLTSNLSIAAQHESDLAASLADMSKQKKAIEIQLSSVQQEREQLQISLQETLSQLEGLTRAKESLNQDLGVKLGEIKNVSSRITELSNEKVKLETKVAEEIAGRMMLQTQLTEVQENLKLAQSEISQVKTELNVLLKQCEERSSIIANLEAEKNDIEDDLCHYGKRLNEQIQENDSLKTEILSLKEEKEKISLECESKTKNISDMQEKLAHVESILHSQLGEMSVERDDLSAQLKSAEGTLANLEKELCALRTTNETQQEQILTQSSQIADLLQKQRTVETAMEELSLKNKCLLDECDEKSEQLMMLRVDLVEVQSASESLQKERDIFKEQVHVLSNKNTSLEEDVVQHISQIETLADQLKNITSQASKVQTEKEDALNKLETAQNAMKDLEAKLESKCKLVEDLTTDLQSKDLLLTQSQASDVSREELLSSFSEKMASLKQERENLSEELRNVQAENQQTHTSLEQLRTEKCEKENDFLVVKAELTGQIRSLQGEVERSSSIRQNLEEEIANHAQTVVGLNQKIETLEKAMSASAVTIQDLEGKLKNSRTDAESKLQSATEMNDDILEKCEKTEEMLRQHKEMLEKSREDKEVLLAQIDELQSAVDVKEELLCDTQKCIEKLRAERDKLRDLLTVKDQIIITHKNTESSLERQSNDELEVAMKLLEGEVHSSHSTSEMMAQELRKAQQNFEEEKVKLEKALEEAQSTAKSFQQETVELKQQLTGPRAGGKLAALQHEEQMWKLDRMKNHLEFQFDSLMTQKTDVEDHLNQLREILKDVSCICDTLFASLPGSCDAVHEVTVMKKEVESKLRAVDKKYADSLCGIISLAHEMFVLRKKQTEDVLSDNVTNGSVVPSDKENIEIRVSKSCEAMTSLMCDVRSAINSCKFLIERCESYLKAQTRESLKIKMPIKEEIPDVSSQSGESKLFQSSGSMEEKSVANFTDDFKNCSHDKSEWFGGSTTLEEGYNAMKKSHASLELRIAELSNQLKELQTSVPEQIHNDMGSKMAKLQDRINVLMLRPTQEQLDDKLKELHNHYSDKLEKMKTKMKQIVKDEVEKVEEEKIKSEKEIIARYSKRISEFEEHVQQLSAQLWKLGEKLLQEQQDHKNAKENLAALKERQRQYLMTKQRTQSLDRLDRLVQGTKKTESVAQLKRRCNSQIAQSSLVSTKVHPSMDDTFDIVDEGSSRRSTMMAPASMGLAFPEEDEDGEVFNNDYLAELKEGKCKVPSDGRLSELQYRNSLCPPHLKSSYPLETQFHDPQSLRDEEIKGPDRRLSRQGKDRGTTSYKKPGPPTPSKKAGRLSLQGKEDVTPRVATLRDHNESVTSQGTGILRAGKTTPSRLRALFTSSKVANAATLPVSKKDENSTPATPTSKRLSIFKRRFGSNKENQSAATGYSSLH